MAITPAQFKVLQRAVADPLGLVREEGRGNGYAAASKRRMMTRLFESGHLTPYVHGGYEITKLGRGVVASYSDSERSR